VTSSNGHCDTGRHDIVLLAQERVTSDGRETRAMAAQGRTRLICSRRMIYVGVLLAYDTKCSVFRWELWGGEGGY
jgi:hypothetical protein